MAYQDYLNGNYSYESRINAQSLDLLQQAEDSGVSDDVIKNMEEVFFSSRKSFRYIEESVHPWYRSRILNQTLQAAFDERKAEREKKESHMKWLTEISNKIKEGKL